MHLSENVKQRYTREHLNAREAQRQAEYIAFAPMVFQVSRLMLKYGILQLLRDSDNGLTQEEIAHATGLSPYAVSVLTEASLSIGTVLINETPDAAKRFTLSKTGWFLLNDPATRVNMDFNHDVCYEGMFHLDEAIEKGQPIGLRHFGDWPTIYEGLSRLPEDAQRSWFAFDHFYSDSSFNEALPIVFKNKPQHLLDVGGNTGRWAMNCVNYDANVQVTICDLPAQLVMMQQQIAGKNGADRIAGFGLNLLDTTAKFPTHQHYEAIWMSQFLDCFSSEQAESILRRAADIMGTDSTLYIMETLWDRQRYEPATLCLTLTSLYFTAMANGNSKMFHTDEITGIIERAGLRVKAIHDQLGQGHSLIEVALK